MNITEKKILSNIKERIWEAERPQRNCISMEKATSPTIFLEGQFSSLKIGTSDIPVAYLHASIPDDEKLLIQF